MRKLLLMMILFMGGCSWTSTQPSSSSMTRSDKNVIPGHDKGITTDIEVKPGDVKVVTLDSDGNEIETPEDINIKNDDKVEILIGKDQKISAPTASHINVTIHQIDKKNDQISDFSATASAKSASVTSNNPKALDMKLDSPDLNFDWGNISGGNFDLSVESFYSGTNLVLLAGVLCIIGGVIVGIWLKLMNVGVALGISGFGLITIGTMYAQYPWIAPVIAIPATIAVGIIIYLELRKKVRVDQTLRTVVKGIGKSDQDNQNIVKKNIKTEAGGNLKTVKEEINNIKHQEGLKD